MTNKPLTSSDHIKVVIFILLFLPSIFLGVGVIPAIFLIFGVFMMKKNEDFSHIVSAFQASKGYILLAMIICMGLSVYFGYMHFTTNYASWKRYDDEFYVSLMGTAISIIYLILFKDLLFDALNEHRDWVEVNGIFSSKPRLPSGADGSQELDIIKGERLKSYSVADELLKWAKLKEDGHISEQEYNDARTKLLKRN